MEIVLWALDLPQGSEVIVPANTFIATAEAVTRAGLKVRFADCGTDYTIDPDSVRENVNENTSAVIPVHLYGQPAKMDEMSAIADEFDLKLVEDSSQAHGAKYREKQVGSIGDAATFSFYPGKNLGAYGDGGAIVTNDGKLAERCRMYSNHGRKEKYQHDFEGRNSRLDSLQAAILSVKLRYLDGWIEKRNLVARAYLDLLSSIPGISLPQVRKECCHAWHLFVIQHPERDRLKAKLSDAGIGTGIHYPVALPQQKAYRHLDSICDDYYACKSADMLLSLPMGEHLEIQDVEKVVETIKSFSS